MKIQMTLWVVMIVACMGCHSKQQENIVQQESSDDPCYQEIAPEDTSFYLYNYCVDVIERPDTVYVINRRLDSTIIHTGIFAYMTYDYPKTLFDDTLVNTIETAVKLDKEGRADTAKMLYQKLVAYYENERNVKGQWFSDIKQARDFHVNTSIIGSYAYERLGNDTSAINALKPAMNSWVIYKTRICQRYIELCIKAFGKERVKKEISKAHRTLTPRQTYQQGYNYWGVKILGADVCIENSLPQSDTITPNRADSVLREIGFYKWVQ